MICNNCGTKVPDGSNRCYYCGAPIEPASAPEPRPAEYAAPTPASEPRPAEYAAPMPSSEPVHEAYTAPMSAVCAACGTPLAEGSSFCIGCGTPVSSVAAPAGKPPRTPKTSILDKLPISKKKLIIAASALLAVVVAIIVIWAIFDDDRMDVAEDYCTAMLEGDAETIVELFPDEVKGFDDVEDLLEELEDNLYYYVERYADQYGDDWDFEVEPIHVNECDKDTLRSLNRNYDDEFDFKVDAAADVLVLVTIEGEDSEYGSVQTVRVVEINGDWYLDIFEFD